MPSTQAKLGLTSQLLSSRVGREPAEELAPRSKPTTVKLHLSTGSSASSISGGLAPAARELADAAFEALGRRLAEALSARDAAVAKGEAALEAAEARALERELELQSQLVRLARASSRSESAAQAAREGADAHTASTIASLEALRQQVAVGRDDATRTEEQLREAHADIEQLRLQLASSNADKPQRDALLADGLKLKARAIALAEANDEIDRLRTQLAQAHVGRAPRFHDGASSDGGNEPDRAGPSAESCAAKTAPHRQDDQHGHRAQPARAMREQTISHQASAILPREVLELAVQVGVACAYRLHAFQAVWLPSAHACPTVIRPRGSPPIL
jgi:hypothetical protein